MSGLKVALVQSNPVWEDSESSLAQLDNILQNLEKDTQLVLLPEMFNTGFSMNTHHISEEMNGITASWLKEKSKRYIIAGSFAAKHQGGYVNRIAVYSQGKCLGMYDKKYLFTLGDEHNHFDSGNKHLEISIEGFQFQFFICYDLRFPEWIRNYSEYDVAVFMASWPKKRMPHWDALLKARAIENQCYVLAVNRVGTDGNKVEHIGHSMAINPFGDLMEIAENKECVTYVHLEKHQIIKLRQTLPFLKDIKNKP